MLLQQSRLCFHPAEAHLPSGAETDHGEPTRPRATLAVSYGKLPNFRTQLRFGRVVSDLYWVAFFRSDSTETTRGAKVGRRRYFERVGSVCASLESTPSSGKNKAGENIARTGHFGSIGIAFPRADLPAQETKKRRSRTS